MLIGEPVLCSEPTWGALMEPYPKMEIKNVLIKEPDLIGGIINERLAGILSTYTYYTALCILGLYINLPVPVYIPNVIYINIYVLYTGCQKIDANSVNR